jgi:hypothetical protein
MEKQSSSLHLTALDWAAMDERAGCRRPSCEGFLASQGTLSRHGRGGRPGPAWWRSPAARHRLPARAWWPSGASCIRDVRGTPRAARSQCSSHLGLLRVLRLRAQWAAPAQVYRWERFGCNVGIRRHPRSWWPRLLHSCSRTLVACVLSFQDHRSELAILQPTNNSQDSSAAVDHLGVLRPVPVRFPRPDRVPSAACRRLGSTGPLPPTASRSSGPCSTISVLLEDS